MIALPSNNKSQLEQQAATLQDKLNQANNDVASKQSALNNANENLNNLKVQAIQAQHNLNDENTQSNAQASYAMNSSEIGNYYTLRSNAATTLDNQSALNDVVPFVNNDVKADTVTSAEGESKEVSSLPQTGETNDKATKEGAIALGFASILAGLGFGYKRRH